MFQIIHHVARGLELTGNGSDTPILAMIKMRLVVVRLSLERAVAALNVSIISLLLITGGSLLTA